MKKILLLLVLSVFLFCSVYPVSAGAESYTLSMLPRFFPKKIKSMIDPLAEYLSQKTGLSIKAVLTKDFAEYEKSIKNSSIDIGYENPLVYVKVSQVHEVSAMAIKGAGGNRFRGIIIARPDSGIETIKDLKHKTIMIVGKTSAAGFLSQKISLADNGLDPDTDCIIEVAPGNKQENVIIAVSIGDVDAGFIRESAFNVADKYIRPGSIAVVTTCAWLPNWAFSMNRTLPDRVKIKITNALLQLNTKNQVLKAMGLDGFQKTGDSSYDIMRSLLND